MRRRQDPSHECRTVSYPYFHNSVRLDSSSDRYTCRDLCSHTQSSLDRTVHILYNVSASHDSLFCTSTPFCCRNNSAPTSSLLIQALSGITTS